MANDGERVIQRTKQIMASGQAASWSHAMKMAAEEIKRKGAPTGGNR